MRGRPKSDNSRTNQYRVRLNDEENRKLDYASSVTGKPKSEILRMAFINYYNTVLLNEHLNNSIDANECYEISNISLMRVVSCPYCNAPLAIDLEDESSVTTNECQMGSELLYEFDYEYCCPHCNNYMRINGYISEYPAGALNHEVIKILPMPDKEV